MDEKLPHEELMTPDEVAAFLQLKRRTVWALVREGKLPAYRIGGSLRFGKAMIERWLETQKTKSQEELRVGRRPRSRITGNRPQSRRKVTCEPPEGDSASLFAQTPGSRTEPDEETPHGQGTQ